MGNLLACGQGHQFTQAEFVQADNMVGAIGCWHVLLSARYSRVFAGTCVSHAQTGACKAARGVAVESQGQSQAKWCDIGTIDGTSAETNEAANGQDRRSGDEFY